VGDSQRGEIHPWWPFPSFLVPGAESVRPILLMKSEPLIIRQANLSEQAEKAESAAPVPE
jgi:hypothetical protein